MSVGKERQQKPERITRTNSGRIIIFFTATQEVQTAKKTDSRTKLREPRDKAPKVGKWVNVYENSSSEKNRGLVLTTLNLSKLGWADSCRRLFGRCNDIYVIDYDDSEA